MVLLSDPAQKCETQLRYFKQKYNLKLFIVFKMAYSCGFGGGNLDLDFLDFLKKIFLTSTTVANLIKPLRS